MHKRFLMIFNLLLICFAPVTTMAADVVAAGILYTKPIESVIFTHQDHAQKDFSCSTCHSGLFEMEALNAQKSKDFTMDSLYKGKYCGACHNGKKAFASDTQCARCHSGFAALAPAREVLAYKSSVMLGKGDKGVAFHHETHVKKATCRSCHPSLFKPKEGATKITMTDHGRNQYCFTCHDQKRKDTFAWSDCSRCHKKAIPSPKEAIHFGKGAKAVSFKHESHQLKAGCKACHPQMFAYGRSGARIDFNDHVNGKSCFTCHAAKDGSAFYDCNRCHKDKPAAKKSAYYPAVLKYKTPVQNVYFHHASHATFSCNQCHPQPFTVKKGQTKMTMSEMYQGKTCGMCHNGDKAFSSRDCARCHKK
ncbi:MAG: cytochrome C [Deltaproteobacteria bacterium HGW-Deltaproteobacteria-6]|jgi:c(7)-type cytochrome triheme protein|nr:MAG: cytochrome C [Deltaproteobacteria bacterium HGW-Deltaproteobacteria-6]